jgi:3-hydroxybutyryl-CoA dehydratase
MVLTLRMLYFEDLSVGMTETLSKTISSSDVVGFAQLTGDRNPIHLSEHFAAKTQFGGRIAHGLYTAGLISAVLGTRLPGPGAIYISQTLACTCTVDDEIVLDGEALVKVPALAKQKRPMPKF